ncbi:MAG: ABC transporter permease [Gammaproteobacteria bacterium]
MPNALVHAARYVPLVLASLRRRRLRTAFTIGSIFIAFLLYSLAGAMNHAFDSGVQQAGVDRLMVQQKVSFILPLPASYLGRVKGIDGVVRASSANWMGGYVRDAREQIPTFPIQPEYLEMYPEILLSRGEREEFLADRTGMLVGRAVADLFGWKLGDVIPLRSSIYRRKDGSNTWNLTVRGIFDVRDDGDTRQILFHYDHFNETLPDSQRDRIGWVMVQIANPALADSVAHRIDDMFANSPAETKTQTERAMAQGFMKQVGSIGTILGAVVSAVFFTMLLVSANTMAQSVRERTGEIGVLKTLGFANGTILVLVLAESVLVTAIGGLLGMGMAWLLGLQLGAALKNYLPGFAVDTGTLLQGLGWVVGLGLAAGAIPAVQAMRLRIVDALRRG